MKDLHARHERSIRLRVVILRAPLPGIEPAATHLQHPTQTSDVMLVCMRLNEPVLNRGSLAKYLAVGSSGGCNSCLQYSRWGLMIQSFPRALIQA